MTPGQDQSILELFNRHFGQLVIYAEAILHDRSRAEDIVQDAFHEAVKQIDEVMAYPNPDGWLREVVKISWAPASEVGGAISNGSSPWTPICRLRLRLQTRRWRI